MDHPFALLSTYNQSAIVYFAEDGDVFKQLLEKGVTNSATKPQERSATNHDTSSTPTKQKKVLPPVSPESVEFYQDFDTQNLKDVSDSETFDEEDLSNEDDMRLKRSPIDNGNYDYRGRKVMVSQVFEVKEHLYKALLLLIESSCASLTNAKERGRTTTIIPKEGEKLQGHFCSIYQNGISWETLNIPSVTYNAPPMFANGQKFHVLAVLGEGRTGRVLLCSSSTGRFIAAKICLFKPSTQTLPSDRNRKEQYEMAVNEEARWRTFNKKYLKFCRVIQLDGKWALTMPVFMPIRKTERKGTLPKVKEALLEMAKTHGYVFRKDEAKWCHFGKRDGKIYLLDYESLVPSGPDYEQIVEDQVKSLERRIGEPQQNPHNRIFVNK